jgi:hypothetical protein
VIRGNLPGGRVVAPLSTAAALAYVLLTQTGDMLALHGAAQAIAVIGCGLTLGSLPYAVARRGHLIDDVCPRIFACSAAALLFRFGYLWHGPGYAQVKQDTSVYVSVLIGTVLLVAAIDLALTAMCHAVRDHTRYVAAVRGELDVRGGITAAISATGVLIALACQLLSLLAVPVVCVPLFFAQLSFRRYARVRVTYQQTIRALSRVTEVAGYTASGHARRVCQLALAIGRDLGMTERELLDLEYGALMHDIGQLSLPEPVAGGATAVAASAEAYRIAANGGAVIRQTGVLDRVAELVERQAEPYRGDRSESTPPPLGSRIIRVANAYDDLAGDSLEPERRRAALERLQLGIDDEYDPTVVASLTRVLRWFARYAR